MRYLLLLVLPLALSSCDDWPPIVDTEKVANEEPEGGVANEEPDPVRMSARFEAVTKNGDTIPVPHTGDDDCGVDERWVEFDLDGTYLHMLTTSFESDDAGGCHLPGWTGMGGYEIADDSIYMTHTQNGPTMGVNDAEWIEYGQSFKEWRLQPESDGYGVLVFERVD